MRKQAPYAVGGDTSEISDEKIVSKEDYERIARENFKAQHTMYTTLKSRARKAQSAGVGPQMEVRATSHGT